MPQPHLPAAAKRFLGRCGTVLVLVACLALGVGFAWSGLPAAGFRGSHGSFAVEKCSVVFHRGSYSKGSSHSHSYSDHSCTGTFRAADGRGVDAEAEMTGLGSDHHAGEVLPAQRTTGHHAELLDPWRALQQFAGGFAFLLPAAFALFWLLTDFGRTSGSWRVLGETWRATRGTATRAAVVALVAVSAVGIVVVSPVLAFAHSG
ncbi:hypothetical protein GCM10012285_33630 [Streptomyces kronopolitis]|uniref:Uncharacterized protein n=1 Tax=Streptomyces kronopolitis TaxID=1612435 RepID=A0ABQ2JL19_9ACTN|nr:hypothetical protein [Streptomyces kronopolitis]GGN47655.1 hypothetical protein GCM10012285_33630 [Streptomyces kronopolitis]